MEYEFEISRNDCSNLDELIDLTKEYYTDADIVNKNYLKWQYFDNPVGMPYLFTSRELQSKELAGQYIVIPIELCIQNNIANAALSLNTLTSPKYQGLGLFTRMAKTTYQSCKKNGVDFIIGFPNQNSYPGFVRKLGFSHLGDIDFFLKPLRPINIARTFIKKKKEKHGSSIDIKTIKHSNIFEFDYNNVLHKKNYLTFWSSIKTQYAITLNKDFKYVKWRFHDIPTRKYKTYCYQENDEILGFVIFKAANVWGFRAGIIVDIMVKNNELNIGKKLIKHLTKLSKSSDLDILTCLHTKNYEQKILSKNGFLKIPKKILPQQVPFILKQNKNEKITGIDLLSDFKLTFGDYDIF